MYNPPSRDTWSLHYPYSDTFITNYNEGHSEGMLISVPLAILSGCPYEPLTFEKAWWAEGFYDAMQDRYAEYREKNPTKPLSQEAKDMLKLMAYDISKRVGDLIISV